MRHHPYAPDTFFNDPLAYLSQRFDALYALLRQTKDESETANPALLEWILRTKPHILQDGTVNQMHLLVRRSG